VFPAHRRKHHAPKSYFRFHCPCRGHPRVRGRNGGAESRQPGLDRANERCSAKGERVASGRAGRGVLFVLDGNPVDFHPGTGRGQLLRGAETAVRGGRARSVGVYGSAIRWGPFRWGVSRACVCTRVAIKERSLCAVPRSLWRRPSRRQSQPPRWPIPGVGLPSSSEARWGLAWNSVRSPVRSVPRASNGP
jgi:hypothetical protein